MKNIVQTITQIIVDSIRPEKIILFGSYARGEENENSDIDFLIIKETNEPRQIRSKGIRKNLRGLKTPIDLLVYTPAEIKKWESVRDSFVYNILKEGRAVYG
jgi:predicted nucleotidyltransferase